MLITVGDRLITELPFSVRRMAVIGHRMLIVGSPVSVVLAQASAVGYTDQLSVVSAKKLQCLAFVLVHMPS